MRLLTSLLVAFVCVLFVCLWTGVRCDQSSEPTLDRTVWNDWTEQPCFVADSNTNQTVWQLVWHDEFDWLHSNATLGEWDAELESVFCGGNGIQQVSCNVPHNIRRTRTGVLVLSARLEPYYEYQYTAATLTTQRTFGHGRWEFRLAHPRGKQLRSTVFTRNDHEAYWHEAGQMDIASNTQEAVVFRGVHFANSSSDYQPMDQLITPELLQSDPNTLHRFHIYGLEWDHTGVRFFLDDQYSKRIAFSQGLKGMSAEHKVRLQIGVGGRLFSKPMPEQFDQLQWKCPAMIVDYVRFYKKVSVEDVAHLAECQLNNTRTDDQTVIEDICTQEMEHFKTQFTISKWIWLTMAIVATLLVLFGLLAYLIVQLVKVKRTVKNDPNRLGGIDANLYSGAQYDKPDEFYETVYDTANEYESSIPYELKYSDGKTERNSYMPLQEYGNRYSAVRSDPVNSTNNYLDIKDGEYNQPRAQTGVDPGDYETLTQPNTTQPTPTNPL